jgi:hypothetical protein
MSITRGASVWTSDGQQIGAVDKLIVSDGGVIDAIVVRRGGVLDRDVEIPVSELTAEADGRLRLARATDGLAGLAGFAEANYASPGADAKLPAGYSADDLLAPTSGHVPLPAPATSESQMAAPADGDPATEPASLERSSE